MSERGHARESSAAVDGQWAVVTGGSKGIGQAIARRLVDGGANVVVVARGREALDEAVASMRSAAHPQRQVIGVVADMADRGSIAELFDGLGERCRTSTSSSPTPGPVASRRSWT